MVITAAQLAVDFTADPRPAINAIDQVSDRIDRAAQEAKTVAGAAMTAFAAVGALALKNMAGVAIDFDQQLANIASVGGREAVARMDELKEVALELGAATSFSATESAAGMEEMIKAGIPVQDVLAGATKAALDLAAATGVSVPEAATIMATSLNVFKDTLPFGTAAENAEYAANILSQAANASAADMSDLALGMQQSANVAASFGVSLEETAAAIAMMSNAGLKGSDAGTSLKTAMLALLDPTDKQSAMMASLGLSFDSFYRNGEFIGLPAAFDILGTAMSGVSDQAKQTALAILFGTDAYRSAKILTDQGVEGFQAMYDQMGMAGTVSEQAEIRLNTVAGALEKLGGALETLKIQFMDGLLPVLKMAAEFAAGVANAVGELSPVMKQIIATLSIVTVAITGLAGAWGLFGSQITTVLRGVALLSPVLLGLAAVAGGLFAAYQTNFMGFADKVGEVVGRIRDFWQRLLDVTNQFSRYFAGALSRGANVVQAFWAAIRRTAKSVLGRQNPVFQFAQGVIRAVRRIANAFNEGGWKAGLAQIWKEVKRAARTAWDQFKRVWGGFVEWAGTTGIPNLKAKFTGVVDFLWTWVKDAVGRIDWDGVWGDLAYVAGVIVGKLGDLATAVASWAKEQIGKVNWSEVWTAAAGAGLFLIGKLGDISVFLANWAKDQVAKVNWDDIGSWVQTQFDNLRNADVTFDNYRLTIDPPGGSDGVTFDFTGIVNAIRGAWEIDESTQRAIEQLGADFGEWLGKAIVWAVESMFKAPAEPLTITGGAGQDMVKRFNLGTALAGFDREFTEALWAQLQPQLEAAKTALGNRVGGWFDQQLRFDIPGGQIVFSRIFDGIPNNMIEWQTPTDKEGEQMSNLANELLANGIGRDPFDPLPTAARPTAAANPTSSPWYVAGQNMVTLVGNGFAANMPQFIARMKVAGMAMVNGLIQGIYDRIAAAVAAVQRMATFAIDAANRALEISSPSRVFQTIGEQTTQGWADGIISREDEVRAAVERIAKVAGTAATAASRSGFPDGILGADWIPDHVNAKVLSNTTAYDSWMDRYHDTAADMVKDMGMKGIRERLAEGFDVRPGVQRIIRDFRKTGNVYTSYDWGAGHDPKDWLQWARIAGFDMRWARAQIRKSQGHAQNYQRTERAERLGITINVNGVTEPNAVARAVAAQLQAALARQRAARGVA